MKINMVLIVIFGILIISIIFLIIYNRYENYLVLGIGVTLFILAIIGIIVSTCIIGSNYIGIDGQAEKLIKQYESIIFQVENNIYENDITKNAVRELVKEAEEWNCNLAWNKANQHDLWIGIYIPDIYDQFEFISIENLVEK